MIQFAAEGLLLAVVAAALGAAMAVFGVRVLVALAPADIPRIAEAAVDLRVLTITLIVAVARASYSGWCRLFRRAEWICRDRSRAKAATEDRPVANAPGSARSWWLLNAPSR